jgi:hypothetical protein
VITSCCPGRDEFDGCSCPDPDPHLDLDLCDDCGVRLEALEVGLCNACERKLAEVQP